MYGIEIYRLSVYYQIRCPTVSNKLKRLPPQRMIAQEFVRFTFPEHQSNN